MKNSNKIERIIKSDLCIGCGFCEAMVGSDKCKMSLNSKGFYEPHFLKPINKEQEANILKVCPGIHIDGGNQKGVWGNVLSTTESWSTNSAIRKKSATGGVTTSLAIYLIESQKVDAILQVGVKKGDWLHNELLISKTKDDIINNAQSRYAPALVFDKIIKIFESNSDIYGFIGKPCDIGGIKNFIEIYPKYKDRIKYTIAIFCAGIPSYNATNTLLAQKGKAEEPIKLQYRGDGWPGEFKAIWKDGDTHRVSYHNSWGKVLGKTLGMRCKICPDGIGMLADISTGDAWNSKDGYPDFSDADGKNFCFIRTNNGIQIYSEAVENNYITNKSLDIHSLKRTHQYQYSRRIFSIWRIIGIQLFVGNLLSFNGLWLSRLALKGNLMRSLRNLYGTAKRLRKIKNG